MASKTPKTTAELVDRLIELENENAALAKRLKATQEMNAEGRKKAVALHNKATKQSTFTNHEVKQHAKRIMDTLIQMPLKR